MQLAELLGLNRLDLIQELLTHRCLLVDSILQEGQSLAPSGGLCVGMSVCVYVCWDECVCMCVCVCVCVCVCAAVACR